MTYSKIYARLTYSTELAPKVHSMYLGQKIFGVLLELFRRAACKVAEKFRRT